MLLEGVKVHIEKGPVDFITNEAKYSLNEEKLIRHQVDFKRMVCLASLFQFIIVCVLSGKINEFLSSSNKKYKVNVPKDNTNAYLFYTITSLSTFK